MKKLIIALLLSTASMALLAANSFAQTLLQYPIPELGYCRDAKECSLYCEIPQNKAACWSYGTYRLGTQVLGESTLSAEEKRAMEEQARELGITFPIAELGGCTGPQECRDFCEKPVNHTTCMAFAQKYGLNEGEGRGVNEAEILNAARTELGCTSMESCRAICEQDHARCRAFAQRHGLSQYEEAGSSKGEILEKAKQELGCSSFEECGRVCETNQTRCMEFAKRHGIYEEDRVEEGRSQRPGGCDSEESCRRYCQEHPSECPGYQEYPEGQMPSPGSFVAPSGCRTEAECQAFCQANPSSCPGFNEAQQNTQSDPSSWCSAQPGCSWNGSYCSCPVTQSQEPPPQQQYTEPVYTESQPTYSPPPDYPAGYPTP